MARATFVDRLVTSDPGLVRLYMAARATAAVGAALGVLLLLRAMYHLPLAVPLLGAAMGMTWTIAVSDANHRDQKITTLILWLPAAACVAIGTLTASNHLLSDALFVGILFLGIYVRRYGVRAAAMGTISVLTFFFALFLRVSPHTLPWLLVALAVIDLATYVFRFIVLPDNPELARRSATRAFASRQRLIDATISAAMQSGEWTRSLQRRLESNLFRLNEIALGLDDLLVDSADRIAVLDAELATGEVAEVAVNDLGRERAPIEPLQVRKNAPIDKQWTPRGPFRIGTQVETGRIVPTTRQALQLTAASVAAIVLGELLSPQRWYWAVLATFVVFLGTSSSGETRNKAWSRIAGTALGILAGIAVTYPVRGHDTLAFVLLVACLFAAVYTVRLSYAMMIFFLTIVLSLLYVLLGYFSDALLLVRLVETALGCALGGIAATLLLPISTRRVMLNVTTEALRRLDDFVGSAVARLSGNGNADTVDALRKFDEALQSVRMQIQPLITRFGGVRNDVFRTRLVMMSACGYYARALASIAYEGGDGSSAAPLRAQREAIHADISVMIAYNDGASSLTLETGQSTPAPDSPALTYLHRIDRALHAFSRTLVP